MHARFRQVLSLAAATSLAVFTALAWPGSASAAAVGAAARGGAAQYRVINLGSLGGGLGQAMALNDRGDAVGYSTTAAGATHPFLWRHGVMTDLGLLDASTYYGIAMDVNISDEVVGASDVAGGFAMHAFLWRHGVMTDLGTLGGLFSVAQSINDRGQVTGWAQAADGQQYAFLWDKGHMTNLGYTQGPYTTAAINDRGQIASSTSVGTEYHGYLLNRGVFTDLGTLGGNDSTVNAMNNAGWIVGNSNPGAHPTSVAAFLWRNGKMIELPGLGGSGPNSYSTTQAINDRGQVLGQSETPSGQLRYVLWQNGRAIDLSTRGIASGSLGVGAAAVTDINNRSQLAGAYYFKYGTPGAALYTPKHN